MPRKICIVTGSRAEFGLLKPLIEEIRDDEELQLQLVVTGMHLSPEFGFTINEIKEYFTVDDEVEIVLSSDTATGVVKSMGVAMIGFADVYRKLSPDIVAVLGDRFEIFSAVSAAFVSRIPVAHISGGELTQGALDDSFRHSITKMSYLHFTATDEYRKRVIQMGESPERVFNVGEIAIDGIKRCNLLSKNEIEERLGFTFKDNNFLVTFHPVTVEVGRAEEYMRSIIEGLTEAADSMIIFTKANADSEGRGINRVIEEYVSLHPHNAKLFPSLGREVYLSLLKYVDAVVGNSSSGIIEAPYFRVPTINIGTRQEGRIKPESVVDCEPDSESIKRAVRVVLSDGFQDKVRRMDNPYGDGDAAKKIKDILKKYQLPGILYKPFYDIPFLFEKEKQ